MLDRSVDRRFADFARSRDPRALADVFDVTATSLLRVARHLARDRSEAEDLVQATFLAAMERAAQYDQRRPLMPWLVGILQHQAADARRRAQRCIDVARIPPDKARDAAEESATREFFAELTVAIARLPARDRDVLTPHLAGHTSGAIGRHLGLSEGAVRVRIHRGLQRLRRALPPGFLAGAWFVAVSPRGLGAVRRSIAAAGTGATGVGAGAWVGGLSMWKASGFVAAAVALLMAVSWIVVEPERDSALVADLRIEGQDPTSTAIPAQRRDVLTGTEVDVASLASRQAAPTASAHLGWVRSEAVKESPASGGTSENGEREEDGRGDSMERVGEAIRRSDRRSQPFRRRGGFFHGLSEEREPIAGAAVRGLDWNSNVIFETTSAPNGSFVIPDAFVDESGLTGFVVAQASGFARGRNASYADGANDDDPTSVEIRLAPACSIEGVVRTESGSPYVGARVEVFDDLAPWLDRPTCVTDSRGAFRLSGFRPVAPRPQTLRVVDAVGRRLAVDELLVDRPVVEHDVIVRSGSLLTVAVVDAIDRTPVAQATVAALGSADGMPMVFDVDDLPVGAIETTDNTGEVLVADVFGSSIDVIASSPMHAFAAARVEIRAGESHRVELALPRAASITGVVVDSSGVGAPGVRVDVVTDVADPAQIDLSSPIGRARALRFPDSKLHPFDASTRTTADGRFALERVAAGTWARVVVQDPSGASPPRLVGPFALRPGDACRDLWIPLLMARRVEFRVLDENDALVTSGVVIGSSALRAWTSQPDSTGTFLLELASADDTPIAVSAVGFRPAFVDPRALASGRVDVRLVRGSTLEGMVVDANGRGRAGVSVVASTAATAAADDRRLAHWFPDRATTWGTTTDADGKFALRELPAAVVDLAVFAPEIGSTTRSAVVSDTRGLTITLLDDAH
jgi:RNA polymerase sigma-70 factor (ECF subfamily)